MILELLKSRLNRGLRGNLFYWRDRTGNEIDLLLDQSSMTVPVEIKSSITFHLDFLKGIRYWQRLNPNLKTSYLIFNGEDGEVDKTMILNWKNISKVKN